MLFFRTIKSAPTLHLSGACALRLPMAFMTPGTSLVHRMPGVGEGRGWENKRKKTLPHLHASVHPLRKRAEKQRCALSQHSEHTGHTTCKVATCLASEQGHTGSVGYGDAGRALGLSATHGKMPRHRGM